MTTQSNGNNNKWGISDLARWGSVIISLSCNAPLTRITSIFQCEGELLKQRKLINPYRGIIDCTRTVFKNEGFWSFWKGNLVTILRKLPTPTLAFFFQDQFKSVLPVSQTSSFSWKLASNVLSGSLAGAALLATIYPLDYIKLRLMNDIINPPYFENRQFSGISGVISKTYKSDGVPGFYRGFTPSIAGIVIYRGLYFGIYDTFKSKVKKNIYSKFAFGWSVTLVSMVASYPLDVVRNSILISDFWPIFFVANRGFLWNTGGRKIDSQIFFKVRKE